jgi:probable F420-dependent oxidoreductase
MMEVGVVLPSAGPKCSPDNVATVARWAEAMGYHSVWVTDHVILPEQVDSRYPYRSHGRWDYPPETPWLDPLLALCWAAQAAPSLTVGTSVYVAPLRHPTLLAKQVSTLDALTGGRVMLGIGAGWMREEFDLMDVSYANRGKRLEEMVELMRTLWTGETVEFEGRYYHVERAQMHPAPGSRRIPIVWGGHSDVSIRRAATLGEGWHPTQIPLEELRAGVRRLREACRDAGRSPESLLVVARPGNTYPLTEEVHAAHLEIGVTHYVADTPIKDRSMEGLREEMERVARICGLRRRQ